MDLETLILDFFKEKDYEHCILKYKESLEEHKINNSSLECVKSLIIISNFYCNLGRYENASQIYEYIVSNFFHEGYQIEYLFLSLLLLFVSEDGRNKTKEKYYEYERKYEYFQSSKEGIFISKLLDIYSKTEYNKLYKKFKNTLKFYSDYEPEIDLISETMKKN